MKNRLISLDLWTSLPDYEVDDDESNNARCQEFGLLEFSLRNEIGQEVRLEN